MIIAAVGEVPLEIISIILLIGTVLVNVSLSNAGARISWLTKIVLLAVLAFFILEESGILLILFTGLLLTWLIIKSRRDYEYINTFSTIMLIELLLFYAILNLNNVFLVYLFWALMIFGYSIIIGDKYVFDLLLMSNISSLIMILLMAYFSRITTKEIIFYDYTLFQTIIIVLFLSLSLFGIISGILMSFLSKREINYYFMEELVKKLDGKKKKKNIIEAINEIFIKIHDNFIKLFLSLSDVSEFLDELIDNTTKYFIYNIFGFGKTAVSLQKNTINRDVMFIMIGIILVLLGGLFL